MSSTCSVRWRQVTFYIPWERDTVIRVTRNEGTSGITAMNGRIGRQSELN